MDRATRLGEGSIPRLLLTFSTPAIVGMLAQALYNIVDRIFVGRAVGPDGLAGAQAAFPFMLIVMACSMLIGIGATALVSIRLGQQRKDEAERVLGNAAVLLVTVSLLLTVTGLTLLDPILMVLGASQTVLPYARDYLQIIVFGCVVQAIGFGLNSIIRGEGNPRIAMITMLIGATLNIILDRIFIFDLGWGMRGAALATVTAQSVSAIWVLSYFLGGNSLLKLHTKNLRLRWSTCAMIIALGSPMFAMQMAASVLNTILNNQLKYHGGDLAVSTLAIVYPLVMLVAMPVIGINQGAQPIIGYNHGAKKYNRVTRTLLLAIAAATVITTTGFLIVMTFPSQVVWLFESKDPELMERGTHAIRISLLMLPLIGFQIVSAGYFQAVGKPRQAMLLSLSRQVLLLIPAVLILPHFFGLDGVWAALPTADFGSSLWTGIWLVVELRHLRQNNSEEVRLKGEREAAEPTPDLA